MKKILVTPRSFAQYNKKEIDTLFAENDIEAEITGKILAEDEMIERLQGKDGLIVGVDEVSTKVLENAPTLKAIAKYGVGVDNIDLDFTKAHNIPVSRTVGSNSSAVADYAFSLNFIINFVIRGFFVTHGKLH